jgi:phosphoribosylanthranilate isomerase
MVKIKICGLTNQADYNNAVLFNADYTGFIFYKNSVRYINEQIVNTLISNGPKLKNLKAGVFVNETIEKVQRIFEYAGLDVIQLHGDEDPAYCNMLGLPYWKAIRIKDEDSLKYLNKFQCDTFLIDAYSENLYGGTGKTIDLNLVHKAISTGKNIFVAGGLSLENIESVLELKPYGVDINSAIEESPGKKNLVKMQKIIEIIKGYNNGNK